MTKLHHKAWRENEIHHTHNQWWHLVSYNFLQSDEPKNSYQKFDWVLHFVNIESVIVVLVRKNFEWIGSKIFDLSENENFVVFGRDFRSCSVSRSSHSLFVCVFEKFVSQFIWWTVRTLTISPQNSKNSLQMHNFRRHRSSWKHNDCRRWWLSSSL